MFRTKVLAVGIVMAMVMVATPASADVISFTPNVEYSGSGDNYTGVITFTLEDVAGGVQFSIDWTVPAAPDPGQFLTGAYLNVDPAINPTAVTLPAGPGTCTGCALEAIDQGANLYQADGDGFYDLLFSFPTANANRFNQGDSYTILLGGPITTSSFLFFDAGGTKGDYMVTARVQGLGPLNEGSGWFGDDRQDTPNVPEPASLALLGLGLAFGAARLRRTRV